MFGESVILVTFLAGIAGRFACADPARHEALTRHLAFPGFHQQVVHPMDSIIFVVIIVLIVLFVLGYFGRGRFRG